MALGDPDTDVVIKARTLNLTRGSGFAALVASGVVVFNDSFKAIFGGDGLAGTELANAKIKVLVPVILAFAVIAVADLLTRAWATASKNHADAIKDAATQSAGATKTAAAQSYVVAAAPAGLTATRTDGKDVDGFTVAALRFRPATPDQVEYLIVKTDVPQAWVVGQHVELAVGAPASTSSPVPADSTAGADKPDETAEPVK